MNSTENTYTNLGNQEIPKSCSDNFATHKNPVNPKIPKSCSDKLANTITQLIMEQVKKEVEL